MEYIISVISPDYENRHLMVITKLYYEYYFKDVKLYRAETIINSKIY